MKALLPVFCRPLGYVILVISMFIPFLLLMQGMVTDSNLLFYKECIKPVSYTHLQNEESGGRTSFLG